MKKKIIKIGNSLGITLPPDFLESKGLGSGGEIPAHVNSQGDLVIGSEEGSENGVSQEFSGILEKVNKKYGEDLRKLANR